MPIRWYANDSGSGALVEALGVAGRDAGMRALAQGVGQEVAMTGWIEMFAPTVSAPELVARGTIVFLALIVAMRIVGQREVGGPGWTAS